MDGNNALEVYEQAGIAIERARKGGGPTLIECLTYRWFGHHEGDPGVAYRTKEEIAEWKARDPIQKLRVDAVRGNSASEEDFDRIDAEVKAEIDDAADFALASSTESIDTAMDHVFYTSAD